ncbi:MAG: hypothetical protein EXS14_08235 [Planctomycetes bacterium]|nr:hypothetical protein [Planctomycetota bacterium]
MARATGLQITETAVRVVEIDGSVNKYRVVTSGEAAIVPGPDGTRDNEALTAAVRACFKSSKAGRERVILGLPAARTVIRELQLPFTDNAQLSKVIKFEFESHMPTGGIEDYVVAFHKISESGPRSRVMVVAVLKSMLKEVLEALARGGIEPAQVDLDAAALCAASTSTTETADEQSNDVLLDVDETTTTVVVTAAGRIRLVRSVRLGSETLVRVLAQDLGVDPAVAGEEARKVLAPAEPFGVATSVAAPANASHDELRAGIVVDRRNEFLRRLSSEVRRTITSVQLDGRITSVRLTGPACGAAELADELTASLGAPVSELVAFGAAENPVNGQTARNGVVALGLALKGVEYDPFQLDFRQEEFRFAHRFDRVRNPLVFCAVLILILLGFLSIWQWNRMAKLGSQIDQLASDGRRVFKDLVVDRAKDPKRMETMNFAKSDEAQALFTSIEALPPELQIARMLAALRPPMEHIEKSYGVHFDGEKATASPENTARSAVGRLDQFMAVLAASRERTGKLFIDRLEVGSSIIVWSMRVESPDAFSILKEGIIKLEGVKICEPGPIALKDGLNGYEGCRIEFESEN